ncbi:MAG TPA: hypothetical protein VFQ77_18450, partial [Pseudonocardiaceae bacterium]|nr:hypothetical protein [Pseudonocardiaceae bacterium]
MSRTLRRLGVLVGVIVTLVLAGAGSASAHPLGNFTVNHYAGLTVHPDRVEVLAVVDSAEIPTLQQRPQVDLNGDGTVSGAEQQDYATTQCAQLADAVRATVDGEALRFTVPSAEADYPPGQANLPTTRLTCHLVAPARLDQPATLSFRDDF